uniref:Putative secreted protein n=1 Tax=Anopheles darlingi TaxID=43151 RepID=A0A2M4DJ74_ANODA
MKCKRETGPISLLRLMVTVLKAVLAAFRGNLRESLEVLFPETDDESAEIAEVSRFSRRHTTFPRTRSLPV